MPQTKALRTMLATCYANLSNPPPAWPAPYRLPRVLPAYHIPPPPYQSARRLDPSPPNRASTVP